MEKQDEIQVKKQTQRTINEMVGPIIFNAYDLVNNYISECRIFSCGNSKLDEFLGGGIFTGELLEVVGPSAVGKTQFCIYSSIQIALNTDYSVLVIDSCASFSVDRAKEMIGYSIMKKNSSASRDFIHQEIQRVLSNIYCFKIFDIFSLINFLDELQVQLTLIFRKSQNYDPFYSKLKVLVIDSLGSILSVIVDKTPFGHSLMIYVSRILKYLATHFHLAIIVIFFSNFEFFIIYIY